MGPAYTELFFLDEVTALAAGHRPCWECRCAEAKAILCGEKAGTFDLRLHEERLNPSHRGEMISGVIVEIETQAYAIKGNHLLRWSFGGYVDAIPLGKADKVLTPPSIIAILAKGYKPRWHSSALQWDET